MPGGQAFGKRFGFQSFGRLHSENIPYFQIIVGLFQNPDNPVAFGDFGSSGLESPASPSLSASTPYKADALTIRPAKHFLSGYCPEQSRSDD